MELGMIEREIYVDAVPDVVFEVVSRPEHIREWWSDEAELDPAPGAVGEIVFGARGSESAQIARLTVVEVDPPRRFSFRWTNPEGEPATTANSLLVSFDLTATGSGTTIRMTESGFRERGWEAAVLEEAFREHSEGWDYFIPRLGAYVADLGSAA